MDLIKEMLLQHVSALVTIRAPWPPAHHVHLDPTVVFGTLKEVVEVVRRRNVLTTAAPGDAPGCTQLGVRP